jgi:TetR/AcrR family transcriptional repressor of nem operon
MAGRPKIFDEQIALERASALFWENGYEATSTEDLIRAMGLQRGSFYHSFGSKRALYASAINFCESNSFNELKNLLQKSKSPIQVIKSVFLSLADCSLNEHKKGCFAGNTLAELSNVDDELVENAKKHLKTLEEIFF